MGEGTREATKKGSHNQSSLSIKPSVAYYHVLYWYLSPVILLSEFHRINLATTMSSASIVTISAAPGNAQSFGTTFDLLLPPPAPLPHAACTTFSSAPGK